MKNPILLLTLTTSLFFMSSQSSAISPSEVRLVVTQSGGAEKFLKLTIANMVKDAPTRLDSDTTLLSGLALGLSAALDHQVTSVDSKKQWDRLRLDARPIIAYQTNKVCSGAVLSVLLKEYGVTLNYRYYAKNGERLFSFEVEKKDCR
jgi:hypothetical protein